MRLFPLRFKSAQTKLNFMGNRWIGFAITFLLIAITTASLMTRGLNLGIDFAGGTLLEIRTQGAADLAKLRQIMTTANIGDVSLQTFGSSNEVLIRIPASRDRDSSSIVTMARNALDTSYGSTIEYRRIESVGPQVGSAMVTNSALAVGFTFLAMLAYLWFRFEWQYGVGGILALLHDALITVGFFSITGIEFNLTSVAAILTIVGYSINDSVVIYDRIRENLRKFKKQALNDILNLSLNETLTRTLLTSSTTIVALLALVMFGGDSLNGFATAMLFGILIGTYSSIYVSAPVLIYFRLRRSE